MTYDFDRLRDDLIDSVGTASAFMSSAMSEMAEIENASDSELLRIARRDGFDPEDYAE